MCSGSVKHLIKWDKKQKFRFATGQSALGQALLKHYGCDHEKLNTVLVVSSGKAFEKSDAYIQVARTLGGLWNLAALIRFIPKRGGMLPTISRPETATNGLAKPGIAR